MLPNSLLSRVSTLSRELKRQLAEARHAEASAKEREAAAVREGRAAAAGAAEARLVIEKLRSEALATAERMEQ